jgi:hypothetical protein
LETFVKSGGSSSEGDLLEGQGQENETYSLKSTENSDSDEDEKLSIKKKDGLGSKEKGGGTGAKDSESPLRSVSFSICMLTLLLMPLAGLHFCVGLDFVTPSL